MIDLARFMWYYELELGTWPEVKKTELAPQVASRDKAWKGDRWIFLFKFFEYRLKNVNIRVSIESPRPNRGCQLPRNPYRCCDPANSEFLNFRSFVENL
jgi:hypothetical protein